MTFHRLNVCHATSPVLILHLNLFETLFLLMKYLGHPYQVYYYNNILLLHIQKRKQGMQSCIPLSFTSNFVSYWCFCFYFCYFIHLYW